VKRARIKPVPPGTILRKEFLKPLGMSQYRLAKDTGLQQTHIAQICNNKREITPRTALRFAQAFGNSAEFWMNLQVGYNLAMIRYSIGLYE
jgi:addiction module HigA family antidote